MARASKVSKEQAREHERRAWELRQKCWTEARIAEEMGLTQGGVSRILSRVERRVLAQLQVRVERQKARQTAQLQYLLGEAVQAWEQSKQTSQTLTRRTVSGVGEEGDDGAGGEVVTQQARQSSGNPSFLAEARAALADLRKLWGLDAATKHDHSGNLVVGILEEVTGEEAHSEDPPSPRANGVPKVH